MRVAVVEVDELRGRYKVEVGETENMSYASAKFLPGYPGLLSDVSWSAIVEKAGSPLSRPQL